MKREDLHVYQTYVVDFIENHEIAAVFLDCGLGKTAIAMTALNDLLFDSFEISSVLVIAPLRVAQFTWPQEIGKWEHLKNVRYSVAVGTEKERLAALRATADIYIINRENMAWLAEKTDFTFDAIVIDELSSFKNWSSKRFKALMKLRPLAKRAIGLTGTPSSNGLMDLFAEFKALDMGERLGRFIGQYRNRYFVPDKRNQQIVFSYKPVRGAEQEIYGKISDITISMKAADHLPMPSLVENIVPVVMSEDEKQAYSCFKEQMVGEIKGQEIDAANAAVLSGKLMQLANGAIYDEEHRVLHLHDRKLDALEDLIEGANGKPVLVAYWYKHDAERIRSRFAVREIKTARDIADWNSGRIPVAVIHPASAGHGLNLQAGGSTLVWFGLTWSLELYQQTNARLWRQGQKGTVVIHHIVTTGTIDERVVKALKEKDKTQAALIEAVKAEVGRG